MNDESKIKEAIQKSKTRLSEENIEEVCKLANCESPQIEHIKSK